jgi:hypothetical protein
LQDKNQNGSSTTKKENTEATQVMGYYFEPQGKGSPASSLRLNASRATLSFLIFA